jgi:hypothetical protein
MEVRRGMKVNYHKSPATALTKKPFQEVGIAPQRTCTRKTNQAPNHKQTKPAATENPKDAEINFKKLVTNKGKHSSMNNRRLDVQPST